MYGNEMFDNSSDVQPQAKVGLEGTAETLVLANAVTRIYDSFAIVVSGQLYIVPGANVEGVVVRVRRGWFPTAPGAIDWELPSGGVSAVPGGFAVTPGKLCAVPVEAAMSPAFLQGAGQYSVTVQQVAATGLVAGNGSVNQASLKWFNTQFVQG